MRVWEWVGRELIEFGARWLIVVLIMFGFGGWVGHRYHALKRDVADLRNELKGVAVPTQEARPTAMEGVSVVVMAPDGEVSSYLNCRIVPPRPEDGAPAAQVYLGNKVG